VLLATRLHGMAAKTSLIAFGVVPSFCSPTTSPASSSTQYQLDRFPKSKPIVSFCEKFLLLATIAVLLFFIAGLLYLLRSERVDNLGAYSIPSGDRPSHPICTNGGKYILWKWYKVQRSDQVHYCKP
jgi:hypothetical protein